MMVFPTDYLWMYMTPAEFGYLPFSTYCIKTWMNIYLLNANIHFQANASEVVTVTQNNQLWINTSVGMEKRCPVIIGKYESDSKQAMLPTGFQAWDDETKFQDYWQTILYGNHKYEYPAAGYELPAYWGEPVENKCYAAICLNLHPILKPSERSTHPGIQDIFTHYQTSTAVSNYNTKMISWSQDWFSPVTEQRGVSGRNYMSHATNQIPMGKQLTHDGTCKLSATVITTTKNTLHSSYKVDDTKYTYKDSLFKPDFVGKFPGG
jgi:hypothetical protein